MQLQTWYTCCAYI